jgi:hypothetical protein
MKTISERFYNLNQSWYYERIVEIKGVKLKVHIRRNAYDNQSHLNGLVFDPAAMKWNKIVHRPIEGAKCESASYVQDLKHHTPSLQVDKSLFIADADSIIEELKAICL